MSRILAVFLLLVLNTSNGNLAEKPMVIIIPSFNNQAICIKNIQSAHQQQYNNFRIIYIDDASTDATYRVIKEYIETNQLQSRITLIHNDVNRGALYNLYHTIHTCADDEIMVTLDGDDWLKHDHVLQRLNQEYTDPNVWMTYGQCEFWPSGRLYCHPMPQEAIENHTIRQHCGCASHLRTFYAWLFKKIHLEDLLYHGTFFKVTWDKAMMAPMLEMSTPHHFRFIPDVLYVYNFVNPLSDANLYGELQRTYAKEIFNRKPYKPLDVLKETL